MRKKRVVRWFAFYFLLRVIARTLKILVAKEVVEIGRKNLPKLGPVFLHANHMTTAEEAGLIFDRLSQGIHIIYKTELERGKNPLTWFIGFFIVRPVLRLSGFIPTNRDIKETTAVEKIRHVIEEGGWLLAMPERTSRQPVLVEGKGKGTARLCMEYNCQVLPVGVSGASGAIVNGLKSYLGLGKKQILTIAYGQSFFLSQLNLNLKNDPTGEKATTAIMVRIGALLPSELWGHYQKEVQDFLQSDLFDASYYREIQSRYFS